MNRQHIIGIIEILISGFCFGFLGIFGKWAFSSGLTPGELLSIRFLIAASLMWGIVLIFHRHEARLSLSQTLLCLAMGVLGYAVFSSCYFAALKGLSASMTSLLLYTFPVMVTVGGHFILREPVRRQQWLALPVVVAGLTFLVWGDFTIQSAMSFLYGVGAAFFYSIYILVSSRKMRGFNTYVATAYIQTGTAIALSLIYIQSPQQVVDHFTNAWLPILGISIIATIIPMTLCLNALKKLSSSEASVLSSMEPVTAIIAAWFILGERLLPIQVLGGALVLLGLFLTSYRRPESRQKI